MNAKQDLLTTLADEFTRWETLLAGLSESQITTPRAPSSLSIKDEVAHLWAWQQRSIARLEGVLNDREPVYPSWPASLDPEPDGQPHDVNAWIFAQNRDRSWSDVYGAWRLGFLRLLELGEAIPEAKLFDAGCYAWLGGYAPADVLTGSYEHHHVDHLEPLLAWLGNQASRDG